MAKWFLRKSDVNIGAMSEALQISPVLSAVLANRGIKSKKEALKFLNPDIKNLYDSSEFKDIDIAVSLIEEMVKENKKIAVYGDYDVDGVMSASILYKALKAYGSDVIYYIPHREEEGYGLNKSAVAKLYDQRVELVITCDNGISAIEEIEYAKSLGIKTIVLDHHEPAFSEKEDGTREDIIPGADAVIDPKQTSCGYPFKALCAAGISYKFVKYFYKSVKKELVNENEYLILAAIATICDIVDLTDENRIIAKNGLELINTDHNTNIGLKALIEERKLKGKKIGSFEAGFILGPCINASGRLETATTSARLFTCGDEDTAKELARKLAELNDERKDLTAKAVESAMEKIDKNDKVAVIYDENIHESIAGIVAGRIKDAIYRPTIVLTKGIDFVKGSARSIEGYNIFEELYKCKELFERFGGHEMAAGFSIKKENIGVLKQRLNDNCTLKNDDFEQIFRVDRQLDISEATFELARELEILEPCGRSNGEPVFGDKGLTADLVEIIGENRNTLKFTFTANNGNRKIKAVCFNKVEQFTEMLGVKYGQAAVEKFKYGRIMNIGIDILYRIDINEYNNNMYVNLKICDFRL